MFCPHQMNLSSSVEKTSYTDVYDGVLVLIQSAAALINSLEELLLMDM